MIINDIVRCRLPYKIIFECVEACVRVRSIHKHRTHTENNIVVFTSFSGRRSCAGQRNSYRQPTDSVQRRLQLLQTIPEGKTTVKGELTHL